MTLIELQVLGAPVLMCRGEPHRFATERLYQLLAYLALRQDWVSRDELTGLLWPELPAASARRNLRKLLFRAHALAMEPAVETQADSLRWVPPTDLQRLAAALAAGEARLALELRRGALLDGMERHASEPFVEWLRFERGRVDAQLRLAVSQHLAALAGDAAARALLAQRWLDIDPHDEDMLETLFDALSAQGRVGEALQAQRDFVERLAQQVGVEPSARVRALAAPRSVGVLATRPRPSGDADLVGRKLELQEIAVTLDRPECRVLTLLGPGGMGKSRLARAALTHLASRFEAGALWIELDDLKDAEQVAPRLAATAAIELSGAKGVQEQVLAALATRHQLLVMDNAEHLPSLGALVARLAESCAALKLLVTSRTRLGVPGEWLQPVEGLPVPDADEVEPSVVRSFDAVRLFERRAVAAAPSFKPQQHTQEIAALVRELGGSPLAIELAAAAVRLLPVAGIRLELAQSLDLLARGTGGRHDSVRASFDHSWRLLAPAEQHALAGLSVFPGSFSNAAASAIADAPLPVLATLVDKSLLRADGEGRFSLHALLRQCAGQHLGAEGEGARRRHALHYAQVVGRLDDAQRGRDKVAMREIGLELENARTAWHWAIEQRSPAPLQAMAMPMARYFEFGGDWKQGQAWLSAAIDRLQDPHPGTGAVRTALTVLRCADAILRYRLGDLHSAEAQARTAYDMARRSRDARSMRAALNTLGLALWKQGRQRQARAAFGKLMELAERDGDRKANASASNGAALTEKALGHFDSAQVHYQRALDLNRELGEAFGVVAALNNLGNLMRALGRQAEACTFFEQAVRWCDEQELVALRPYPTVNLGLAAFELGDFGAAERWLREAHAQLSKLTDPYLSVTVPLALARIATARGDLAAAPALLDEASQLARRLDDRWTMLNIVLGWAEWLARSGQVPRAAAILMFVVRHEKTEAASRSDARRLLESLALTRGQRRAAVSDARGFELQALVASLSGKEPTEQR